VPTKSSGPLFATVNLDRGETGQVPLARRRQGDGQAAEKVKETHESLRDALRRAELTVEINGRTTTLTSGNCRLPITVGGVQTPVLRPRPGL
jgi:hypothetical protein